MSLDPCDYRLPTTAAERFYCRHDRVHAAGQVVSAKVCELCVWREIAPREMRPAPAGPIHAQPAKGNRPDCRHKGDELRRETCQSCAGSWQVKVFACSLHSACSMAKQIDGVACCAMCGDYSPALSQ